jgi:hypothetical protein
MLGLFFLLMGLGAMSDSSPMMVLFGLMGLYILFRQFEISRQGGAASSSRRQRERPRRHYHPTEYDFGDIAPEDDPKASGVSERVHPHALQAVQMAGLDPSQLEVLPVDIGVFAHKDDNAPQLYRTLDIPDNVDYLQPFVQLRLPRRARGKVTFEIINSAGEMQFQRTEEHDFSRGRNLIVPARRLPIHDALDLDNDEWALRVSADGILLAVHEFGWQTPEENIVTGHLQDDGEISNELRAAIAESHLSDDISLDELLSFQQDEDTQQSTSSRR